MAKPAYNLIVKNAGGKPSIIYVSSKKQVQMTAIDMMAFATSNGQASKFLNPNPTYGGNVDAIIAMGRIDDAALGIIAKVKKLSPLP